MLIHLQEHVKVVHCVKSYEKEYKTLLKVDTVQSDGS